MGRALHAQVRRTIKKRSSGAPESRKMQGLTGVEEEDDYEVALRVQQIIGAVATCRDEAVLQGKWARLHGRGRCLSSSEKVPRVRRRRSHRG